MRVEIKVPGPESNVPPSDRRVVIVETHEKRGDTFVKNKSDNVMEGDSFIFTVPDGGRLVLDMPLAQEKVVVDKDQNAAIMPSRQANDAGRADKPTEQVRPVVTPAPSQTVSQNTADASGRPITTQNDPNAAKTPAPHVGKPGTPNTAPAGATGGIDTKNNPDKK